jgi:heterodisulfide reductase subunit A-like polyferredoxin
MNRIPGADSGSTPETATGASPEVVVVGAGVSGIRAALDLAETGRRVALLEKGPVSGGLLLSLDRQFPDNHCGFCRMLPLIDRDRSKFGCMRRGFFHERIIFHPATHILDVQGVPGDLTVRTASWPLAVDPSRCSACGACIDACPVVLPNPDCDGLVQRKAIFRAGPHVPGNHLAIDPQACTLCGLCVSACPEQAVSLAATPAEQILEHVGAVIYATGVEFFDPAGTDVYGYGRFPDVITSLAFERLLSKGGPTGGELRRLSDNKPAQRVAWIQCVGSRNLTLGADHCSGACCMFALKQAVLAREKGSEATIFYMDLRTHGRDWQSYRDLAEAAGVRLIRCRPHSVESTGPDAALRVSYAPVLGKIEDEPFDMVVLSTGRDPAHALPAPASLPGIFTTEGSSRLLDISESLISSSDTACRVAGILGGRSEHTAAKPEPGIEIKDTALVVGAGPAGLSAALALAGQGVRVFLVDRDGKLGGNLPSIIQSGVRIQVQDLVDAVQRHERIEVLLRSVPVSCKGPVGRFTTVVRDNQGRERALHSGAVIVATGGGLIPSPHSHPSILSVFDLAIRLEEPDFPGRVEPSCLVFLLCAGTRQPPFNYCSRLCCPVSLETALRAKQRWPGAEVVVFYRDIITPGDAEKLYTRARQGGVRFIAYDPAAQPEIVAGEDRVVVSGQDPLLGEAVRFEPDFLGVATGLQPEMDTPNKVFALRTTSEGFLREADAKWRPVDSGREGIYLCGLARNPVTAEMAMAEGRAAAMRAMRLLYRRTCPQPRDVVRVRPALCSLCGMCRTVCPYQARYPDSGGFMAVDPLACQGCGACAAACPNGACVLESVGSVMEISR